MVRYPSTPSAPRSIIRPVARLTLIALVAFASDHTCAETRRWVGPGLFWHSAGNWNPVGVPTASDTAFADVTTDKTILLSENAVADTLVLYDGNDLITQDLGLTVVDQIIVGNFGPPGSTRLVMGSSTVTASSLRIGADGELQINDGTIDADFLGLGSGEGRLRGRGTVRLAGNATRALGAGGAIIAENGTLTIEATGLGSLDIDNIGNFATARLDVGDGGSTLILDGPITDEFDGTTLIGENSTLHVTQQWAHGPAAGMTFDGGTGSASLTGAPFTSRGPVFVDSGTAAFDNDEYTIASSSIVTVASGAELSFANSPVQQGTIQLNGGTLSGPPLTNEGGISGFGTISNSLFINNDTLTASGSTLRINSATALFVSGSTTTLNTNLELHGDTLVQNGAIFTGPADLIVAQPGTLRTNGDVSFDQELTSHGAVAPGSSPATISLGDSFEQTATGVLEIEIGGTALDQFDRLVVTGFAQLDGTLSVSLINSFEPDLGETFEILAAQIVIGEFATESLPTFAGRTFDVIYGSQGVMLQVIAGSDDIFADGFEATMSGKSCFLSADLEAAPERFRELEATVVDLDTGLEWGTLESIKVGQAGDHSGPAHWRLPTPAESRAIPGGGCRGMVVREL